MKNPAFPPTFTKTVYSNGLGVNYTAAIATREEADSWAAEFPKSCKVWAADLGGHPTAKAVLTFTVMFPASNKGMGQANEAGATRERSFLKHVKRLGLRVAE